MSNYVEGGVIRANTDYSVRMPLTAFSKRTNPKNGGEFFDFMHFKDFTWNNFQPVNVDYRFSNFLLVGNCSDSLIGVKDKQLDGEQAQEDLEDTTVGTELNTSPSPSPTSSQVGLYSVGSFILGSLFTLLL